MSFTTNPGKELNCRECGDLVKNVGHEIKEDQEDLNKKEENI
jgi:hypothetical protein